MRWLGPIESQVGALERMRWTSACLSEERASRSSGRVSSPNAVFFFSFFFFVPLFETPRLSVLSSNYARRRVAMFEAARAGREARGAAWWLPPTARVGWLSRGGTHAASRSTQTARSPHVRKMEIGARSARRLGPTRTGRARETLEGAISGLRDHIQRVLGSLGGELMPSPSQKRARRCKKVGEPRFQDWHPAAVQPSQWVGTGAYLLLRPLQASARRAEGRSADRCVQAVVAGGGEPAVSTGADGWPMFVVSPTALQKASKTRPSIAAFLLVFLLARVHFCSLPSLPLSRPRSNGGQWGRAAVRPGRVLE